MVETNHFLNIIIAIILGLIFIITLEITIKTFNYIRGYRETTIQIVDSHTIYAIYKGKTYNFNLLYENENKRVKLIHYTSSNTVKLKINNTIQGNNKVVIQGNESLLHELLTIANYYGIPIKRVNDAD